MEITSLGHSSFKIRGKSASVVTDPFDPEFTGLKFPQVNADIVTISHRHNDHNYLKGISGEPFVVDGPGEYDVKGISILGLSTFHDDKKGSERGRNTVYEIRMDGLSLVHLGDLGEVLSDESAEQLDGVDLLFVPVGGYYTLATDKLQEVINKLEPKIIIPMHYSRSGLKPELSSKLATVEEFLKAMGKTEVMPQDKLVISRDKLGEETQIIVLK
ncbi:MAG: MBL fold metallo-hydrolase [Patescibacteria group bacterium]|nr:MBL fold metallo-hydrolase [Patescibacteria group bacterium]